MKVVAVETSTLVHPPGVIEDFVLRLVRNLTYYQGVEPSSERRYRVAIPLLAMPLDERLKPAGDIFAAVTRDLSAGGICLYHLQPVVSPFLAVDLTEPDGHRLEVAVEIRRCQKEEFGEILRCQRAHEFYEIAGKFVTKIYSKPDSLEASNELE